MKQDLKSQYNSLPEDVKTAINSTDVPKKIQTIANNHHLHVDQIEILEEAVGAVMLGIMNPNSFVDVVEERLGISTEEAINLTTEVNAEIFLAIRQSLMEMNKGEEDTEQPKKSNYQSSQKIDGNSREAILAEIENPQPVTQPISTSNKMDTVTKNFIGGKLTETVSMPTQKVEIELKKPEVKQKYTADPYRENIV